jgi:hypothetical protein
MAEMTVNHPHKLTKAPAGSVRDFCASDAALVLRNVTAARAILRAVALRGQLNMRTTNPIAGNLP